jgi:magnesium transporter
VVENKLARYAAPGVSGETVLMELLDAVIDRWADILERAGADIDAVSREVFEPDGCRSTHSKQYANILTMIGRKGDLTSKVRESLVAIGRLVTFVAAEIEGAKWSKDMREQLKTMQRDVQSLADHASFLSNKTTFVLDAMLGVVNLEQNSIVKLFSVMAVLMPPTLIASIYGMNFKTMPELEWQLGYPLSIGLMVLAAIVPYSIFKLKRWL